MTRQQIGRGLEGVIMKIDVGDVITLKKAHPCGSKEWSVVRTGSDFRLKCEGCGHSVMLSRELVEKNIKMLNGEKI